MVRVLNTVCVALMGLSILALYHVSETTRVAGVELRHVESEIAREQATMSVLETEWARVAGPERIQALAENHLGLTAAPAVQLSSFEALPRRGEDAPLADAPIRQPTSRRPRPRRRPNPDSRHAMEQGPTIYQRRIVIGAALCAAAFALVGVRLVDVTLVKGRLGGAALGEAAVAPRADLVDRNGELLARDLPVMDLYARPHALDDKDEAARGLAAATGADYRRLRRALDSAKSPYVLVRAPAHARRAGQGDAAGPRRPGVRARSSPTPSATIRRAALPPRSWAYRPGRPGPVRSRRRPRRRAAHRHPPAGRRLHRHARAVHPRRRGSGGARHLPRGQGRRHRDGRQHRRGPRHGVGAQLRSQQPPFHRRRQRQEHHGRRPLRARLGVQGPVLRAGARRPHHPAGRSLPHRPGLPGRQVHDPRSRAHAGDLHRARDPRPFLQHRHRPDRAALRRRAPARVPLQPRPAEHPADGTPRARAHRCSRAATGAPSRPPPSASATASRWRRCPTSPPPPSW